MNYNYNHYEAPDYQGFVQRWNDRVQVKKELIFAHATYGIVDWICRELQVSYNFDRI